MRRIFNLFRNEYLSNMNFYKNNLIILVFLLITILLLVLFGI